MERRIETPSTAVDLLNPLSGWEAAARWNAATFGWMAKGWQQWIALVTTLPQAGSLFVTPAQAGAQDTRSARASNALDSRLRANDVERAVASTEPKRPARAKAQRKSAPKKAAKARTRG